MTNPKKQINIARIIYDAYPHSDLLPIEPDKDCLNMERLLVKVTGDNIGDGLFKFIVTEIVEGGEGSIDGAIRVTEQAREDVESVLQALYAANTSQSGENNRSEPAKIMHLYEVQATEYNGEQEYSQSKLIVAENMERARNITRDYFRQWYDDGDELQAHDTDNPDEFEFICGCIRLKIRSIQRTTIDKWLKMQISLHSISELPNKLTMTKIEKSSLELLEACKVLTSYTMDLLYRLDNQVNLEDIEELQQAIDVIDKHSNIVTNKS